MKNKKKQVINNLGSAGSDAQDCLQPITAGYSLSDVTSFNLEDELGRVHNNCIRCFSPTRVKIFAWFPQAKAKSSEDKSSVRCGFAVFKLAMIK